MPVQVFTLTFVFTLFCQGTICNNLQHFYLENGSVHITELLQANTKILFRRSKEANQSNNKGSVPNLRDEQPLPKLLNNTLKNDKSHVLKLGLDDVFKPVIQNVPFNVKNMLSSSSPQPAPLLFIEDGKRQEPNSKLNTSQNDKPQYVSYKIKDDESTIPKKHKSEQKSSIKSVEKNMNDKEINRTLGCKSGQNITDVNKKRHNTHILENKSKKRTNYEDGERHTNKSSENFDIDEHLEKAVTYLLKNLGNFYDSKELDLSSTKNAKTEDVMNMDIGHKEEKNSDNDNIQKSSINEYNENLKIIHYTTLENISQLLQEQNNLLKEIIFKAINRNNQTSSDESTTKTIHLILDINNLDSKRYNIPVNLEAERNHSENVPDEATLYIKDDALEEINNREQLAVKNRNNDLSLNFQQYPQQYILNSYFNRNYPFPYFTNPVNQSPTYSRPDSSNKFYGYKPYSNPSIASSIDSTNQFSYDVLEESEDMTINKPKINKQTNDGMFNNYLKHNDFKKPSTPQSTCIYYYNQDPQPTFSKFPFYDLYYSRQ